MPPGGSKLCSSTSRPSSVRSASTWSRTKGPSAGRLAVGYRLVTTSTRTGGNLSGGFGPCRGGHTGTVAEQTVGLVIDPMGAAGEAARERLAEALEPSGRVGPVDRDTGVFEGGGG